LEGSSKEGKIFDENGGKQGKKRGKRMKKVFGKTKKKRTVL